MRRATHPYRCWAILPAACALVIVAFTAVACSRQADRGAPSPTLTFDIVENGMAAVAVLSCLGQSCIHRPWLGRDR